MYEGKAQAMLVEKDAAITSLLARLRAGAGGEGGGGVASGSVGGGVTLWGGGGLGGARSASASGSEPFTEGAPQVDVYILYILL
jgi:hypothetical protein